MMRKENKKKREREKEKGKGMMTALMMRVLSEGLRLICGFQNSTSPLSIRFGFGLQLFSYFYLCLIVNHRSNTISQLHGIPTILSQQSKNETVSKQWLIFMTVKPFTPKDAKQQQLQQRGVTLLAVPCWWDGSLDAIQRTIHFYRPDLIHHLPNSDVSLIPLNPVPSFFGGGLLEKISVHFYSFFYSRFSSRGGIFDAGIVSWKCALRI